MDTRESRYVNVARSAYHLTQAALPRYSHPKRPHHDTLPQLAACVLLMVSRDLSYRDMEEWLLATDQVRQALDLSNVPDHTTLQHTFLKVRIVDGEQMTHRLLEEQGVDDEDVAADRTGFAPGQTSRYDLTRTGRRSHRWVQSLSETWGEMPSRPTKRASEAMFRIGSKPYRWAIALVRCHWSGNQHRVVVGSNRISTRWTDGEAHLPGAVRISDNAHNGVTTTDHVPALVTAAAARGCQPHLLGCDRWSARVAHVTLVHPLTWQWLSQLNVHRLVDPDGAGNRPIRAVLIPRHGAIVHLTGYGCSNGFTMAPPAGGIAD